MSTPITPPHPNANSEVDLTNIREIPRELENELQLNPDLSDDEEEPIKIEQDKSFKEEDVYKSDTFKQDLTEELVLDFKLPSGLGPALSLTQQSRFISFVDDKLLQIQRNFIKYLSEEDSTYTLSQLIRQINETISILWYSIFRVEQIPVVFHSAILGRNSTSLNHASSVDLFGQPHYFIRIIGDLIDYVEKFPLSSVDELRELLALVAKLDNVVIVLVDQDTVSTPSAKKDFIDKTEKVRLLSLATRFKLLLLSKYEELKTVRHPITAEFNIWPEYDQLVGQVYEGIIDRTSI
ncbi:TFIIH complex subunit [Komagataella phaffii CBS 7435]|uniref:TFIIH complex subunit n=2 Tax=Komagataella phaffii TaxID=460519 RepID=C4R3Y9_KOMPG|nr:uncharacterized protein PAS_chr3_0239 [Komagataella phaffii GS115]AOA63196.1 GQ67_03290T0 [Komagataella phaffii]CAH2449983.1 TFIIH complex subunit [Komagataella phaffii CBS 7435]AOA68907.1 GQ68_03259T0 [Komagataella phaffii GS115]CAY70264.1 Putative protein of unknown function [Komagataella phaffii GS115]CCA39930.1 TFIIH complex subunit [Komagataella phaffii CBS 7435]